MHLPNTPGDLSSVSGVATESCITPVALLGLWLVSFETGPAISPPARAGPLSTSSEVTSHMDSQVSDRVGRDEDGQWADIYRKFAEITSMLAWAELATSPGDASTVELPSEQASAISFCIRRARIQLQEIHAYLQSHTDSKEASQDGQALDTGT